MHHTHRPPKVCTHKLMHEYTEDKLQKACVHGLHGHADLHLQTHVPSAMSAAAVESAPVMHLALASMTQARTGAHGCEEVQAGAHSAGDGVVGGAALQEAVLGKGAVRHTAAAGC